MKKALYAMIMVPVAIIMAFGLVNFVSGILTGEISILTWVLSHKILLVAIVCYVILQFVGPFKKKG